MIQPRRQYQSLDTRVSARARILHSLGTTLGTPSSRRMNSTKQATSFRQRYPFTSGVFRVSCTYVYVKVGLTRIWITIKTSSIKTSSIKTSSNSAPTQPFPRPHFMRGKDGPATGHNTERLYRNTNIMGHVMSSKVIKTSHGSTE